MSAEQSPTSQQDRRPKYRSQIKLSKGFLKIAAWSHSEIQIKKTVAFPSSEDSSKFIYEDLFTWSLSASDIQLVVNELQKARSFCESKEPIAPEPPKPRQLIFGKIPETGEIQLSDLRSTCVPSICPKEVFVAEMAELDRLGVIKKRIEGADTLFPVVWISRMAI